MKFLKIFLLLFILCASSLAGFGQNNDNDYIRRQLMYYIEKENIGLSEKELELKMSSVLFGMYGTHLAYQSGELPHEIYEKSISMYHFAFSLGDDGCLRFGGQIITKPNVSIEDLNINDAYVVDVTSDYRRSKGEKLFLIGGVSFDQLVPLLQNEDVIRITVPETEVFNDINVALKLKYK